MLDAGLVGCRTYCVPPSVTPAYAAVGKLPVPGRANNCTVLPPPYRVLLFTAALIRSVQPSIEKSPTDGSDGRLTRWFVPLKAADLFGSFTIAPADPRV